MRALVLACGVCLLGLADLRAQITVDVCGLVTVAELETVFHSVEPGRAGDATFSAGSCRWAVSRQVPVPGRRRPMIETDDLQVSVLTAETIRRDFGERDPVRYFREYLSPERKDGGAVRVGDEGAMASRPGPGFRRTTLKARKGNRLIELSSNHPDTEQLQAAARLILSKL